MSVFKSCFFFLFININLIISNAAIIGANYSMLHVCFCFSTDTADFVVPILSFRLPAPILALYLRSLFSSIPLSIREDNNGVIEDNFSVLSKA